MNKHIPMSSPDLATADIAAVNLVLQTRYLSIGPQIKAFEEIFAAAVGSEYVVGVDSGTGGLHHSFEAHRTRPLAQVSDPQQRSEVASTRLV